MLRRLGFGVLGLACLAGLAFLLRPQPLAVDVATVTRGALERTVEEDGRTRVRDRYVVAAPIAGTLRRIALDPGDVVREGDVVATLMPNPAPLLDPRTRQALAERLGAALATQQRTAAVVARVTATLAQAQADLERTRTLAARGVVPPNRLEHDETAAIVEARLLDAARFDDHVATHEVEVARAALSRANPGGNEQESLAINAPAAGRVLRVLQASATPVAIGTPLLEIGDVSRLEVVADVLSTNAVAVAPGQMALITQWGGPGVLEGRVQRVEPSAFTKVSALGVEEQRTNVVIDIVTLPQAGAALGDGYAVNVAIVVARLPDVVKLPTSALFRDGAAWRVFRVVDGVAHSTKVEPGLTTPTETAVTAGLHPGDRVVAFPGDTLRDGMRVSDRSP